MAGTACVLAPDPLLTVTVEASPDGDDELHLHAGGQSLSVRAVESTGHNGTYVHDRRQGGQVAVAPTPPRAGSGSSR